MTTKTKTKNKKEVCPICQSHDVLGSCEYWERGSDGKMVHELCGKCNFKANRKISEPSHFIEIDVEEK